MNEDNSLKLSGLVLLLCIVIMLAGHIGLFAVGTSQANSARRTADAHTTVSENEKSKGDIITTSWRSKLLGVDTTETAGNARLPGETPLRLLERHEEFTRSAMVFQTEVRK